MRYNPCGYIVDWSRAPYTQECRFFRDDDRIDTVRWVQAEPTALTLPFPSVICVSTNEQDRYLDSPIGEVYGARHRFSRKKVPNGLFSGHFCGTETDFAEGCHYDDEAPPVRYNSAGYPICCAPPVTVLGGAAAGGMCTFEIAPPIGPGPNCPTAYPAAINTSYPFTLPGPGVQWWRFPTVPGTTNYLTMSYTPSFDRGWTLLTGTSCTSQTVFTIGTVPVTRFAFFTSQPFAWMQISASFFGYSYTVKVEDH